MRLYQNQKYHVNKGINVVFSTPQNYSHFFGYYYNNPISKDNRHMLSHRLDFDGRAITTCDKAEVGYFDLDNGQWHAIGQTAAFNWQQGAMLQWLGPDYQSRLIYNGQAGDSFVSIVVDLNSGKKRMVPFPVYAVHPSGKIAISVNFERHFFCRAYHYEGIRNEKWNCLIHPEDGIFRVDLDRGSSELILRTEDISRIDPLPEMAGASHWLEHVIWNPVGTRFAFLHRFGKGEDFKTRLYTADADGKNLYRFPDMAVVSHMAWRNDEEFVAWARTESNTRKAYVGTVKSHSMISSSLVSTYRWVKKYLLPQNVIKSLSRGGAAYMHIRDKSNKITPIGPDVLCEDGHPSWTHDGRYMLTDTYATQSEYRQLILYDANKGQIYHLGKFHSRYNNSGYRCDLHPRFSYDEKRVIIDSFHADYRQMFVLDISKVLSL